MNLARASRDVPFLDKRSLPRPRIPWRIGVPVTKQIGEGVPQIADRQMPEFRVRFPPTAISLFETFEKFIKKPGLRNRKPGQIVEAAGIAPASHIPEVLTPHSTCVDTPPPCLHTACTDLALRELVASWHRLTPDVRETIVRIARGQGDFSRVGE